MLRSSGIDDRSSRVQYSRSPLFFAYFNAPVKCIYFVGEIIGSNFTINAGRLFGHHDSQAKTCEYVEGDCASHTVYKFILSKR